MKGRFYVEAEHVFDKFPKYNTKILLGEFNAKVGREDIFKPTNGNESLHDISDDNGIIIANFATSQKSDFQKIQHSRIITFKNLLGLFLMERRIIKLTIF
jgi:hypothetical protein